jgi:protein involved in polysaccharide export with SLBB domain
MKTIVASIAHGVFFSFAAVLLLLTPSQLRAAEARQNGANDESEPIQLVYVTGQVKIPNRYVYTNGMTLSAAIKMAKGVTEQASPTKVTLTREGKKPLMLDRQKIKDGTAKDIKLQPGDKLFVPQK